MIKKITKITILLITISLQTSCSNQSEKIAENSYENGELDSTFVESIPAKELTSKQIHDQEKEKLISEGWQEQNIPNGQLPSCYNYKPRKGKVKNHLEIYVGSGTDVSIKVMNLNSNKCVRYVFINSGSTYTINNIPEGEYFLKIAYGKNWITKVENGQCIGKFTRNPMYEKGEDIMDFNIKHSPGGYSIPSFKLQLDIVSSSISNSFSSQNISESEFNQ